MGGVARQRYYVIVAGRLCDWWREFEPPVEPRTEKILRIRKKNQTVEHADRFPLTSGVVSKHL